MNIALINPEYPSPSGRDHGGIATYVYTMANALTDAGHHVHVLARKDTVPDMLSSTAEFHTFNHAPLPTPFSFISRRFNSKVYWERGCSQSALDLALSLHNKISLNVVEIPEYNGLATQFLPPLPFQLVINFHTPTILIDELNLTPITAQQKKWYYYEKRAVKNATAFRCPSKSLAEKLRGIFSLSPEKITVIRNPIPTTFFDGIEKRHDTSDERCEILFSGRLERRKGAEVILRTISDILDIDTSIHITFAGETELGESENYRQAMERAVKKEYRERIWFLGPQTRDKLSLLLCRSDIFIMPSLFENAPYALLEAMAAKLPVIGADTSGISEMIEHNKTGLLFSLDNPLELCTCIKKLISKPDLRKELSRCAYEHVRTIYDPGIIAQQTIAFYESIKTTE